MAIWLLPIKMVRQSFLKQVATYSRQSGRAGNRCVSKWAKLRLLIDILRSSDANVIEVVDNTYKTLESIQAQLPARHYCKSGGGFL